MAEQKPTGKLIVIDGIDGAGKTTQAELLRQHLEQTGHKTATIKFPQYEKNFFGRQIRGYLKGIFGPAFSVNPHLASILYAADRWESSSQLKDWLNNGNIIVLDRYYTSNLIHQAAKLPPNERQQFIAWLDELEFATFKIPRPDLVICLHIPATVSHELITSRGQGHDGHELLEFLELAESACMEMAQQLNWQIVECCENNQLRSKEEIAQDIQRIVQKYI